MFFDPDVRVYWIVCQSALMRGNSGFALRRVAEYHYWNGRQWSAWFSRG